MKLLNKILFIAILITMPLDSTSMGFWLVDGPNRGAIDDKYNSIKSIHVGSQSCADCHVPIDAATTETLPKWMNENSAGLFEIYKYNSAFSGEPNSSSKLCLSCHDGTFAVEDESVYESSSQSQSFSGYTGNSNHPVSIPYNSELASRNTRLADPFSTPSGLGGTIDEDLLVNGQIECITCHNVHQQNSGSSSTDHYNLSESMLSSPLKISNSRSGLCLTCHLM